jgi:hypothetical protein
MVYCYPFRKGSCPPVDPHVPDSNQQPCHPRAGINRLRLQRAIKIEPRNPHSWHYLAETYWRSGDNLRCLEMVERSRSYSSSADDLEHANQQLREKCQQG